MALCRRCQVKSFDYVDIENVSLRYFVNRIVNPFTHVCVTVQFVTLLWTAKVFGLDIFQSFYDYLSSCLVLLSTFQLF